MLAVAKCRTMRELGAQGAALTPGVLAAILGMPNLECLDLEATAFDDQMAADMSGSTKLVSLDLGATNLSGRGLAHICKMKQLRHLDLWATKIQLEDVDHLSRLPNLESLTLGNFDEGEPWAAENLLPKLLVMQPLRRIWLDGIPVNDIQKIRLESRFEDVRLTI